MKYVGFFDLDGILDQNPDQYVWDDRKKLFINTTTDKTITARQMRDILDVKSTEKFESVSATILSEPQSIERQYQDFWYWLTIATIDAFLVGSGGKPSLTPEAKIFLETALIEQAYYYKQFGQDILAGRLSLAQIADRFRLYAHSISGQYEKGRVWAYGKGRLVLPTVPRAGGTACGTNCKCHLNIREFSNRWEVRWVRTAKESCTDCVYYGTAWQPYTVYK